MFGDNERAAGTDRRPAVADSRSSEPQDASALNPYSRALRTLAYATILLPLVAVPGILFPFVVPRAVLFRMLMGAAVVVLVAALLLRRTTPGRRDPILAALVLFFLGSLLSAFAGVAAYRSLYGNLERMWGVWGWFNIAVLYVLLRAAFDERGWTRWLRASLWISGLLGLYAIAQYYQLRIPFTVAAPGRPFATLGNPGYLAVFALLQIGLGLLLRCRDPRGGWVGRGDYAALALSALALLLANTRSAFLGAAAGAGLVAAILMFIGTRRQRRFARILVIAGTVTATAAIAFSLALPELVANVPGLNRLAVTSAADTNIRLIAWQFGLEGFRERPLLGWGMDNFPAIFDAALTPAYFSTPVYNTPFDRVHNAYIELLATVGILGLLTFLAIFASAGWTILSGWQRRTLSSLEVAIFAGVLSGYLVYLVFWFEDLSSLIALTALLALLGSRSSAVPLVRVEAAHLRRRPQRVATTIIVGCLVAAALWLHAWKPLVAARALERLDSTAIDVRIPEDLVEASLGADLSRTHALTILTLHLRGLVGQMEEIRRRPEEAEIVARRLERTLTALEREIERDPRNSTLQIHRATTLLVGALLTRGAELYESSLDAYRTAIRLSPNQVHHRFRIAEALALTGRHAESVAHLDTAAAIAPAFGATDYFRARFALQRGDVEAAAAAAHAAIEKGYVLDARIGLRLDEAMEDTGRPLRARIGLLRAFLLRRRGAAGLVAPRATDAAADRPLLRRLAELEEEMGDTASAQRLRRLVTADSLTALEQARRRR